MIQPSPSLNATKGLFLVSLALLVVGGVGLIYVLWQSLISIPTHMPSDSFAIFERPASNNPQKLYESYRVFFVHLPSAYASATVSLIMAIGGMLFFLSKKERWANLVVAAAEVGLAACAITMLTGYFWGEYAWGKGWTWEPRLTSALILWLSYLALLLIRRGIDGEKKRMTVTAAYGLLTAPLYPLVNRAITLFGRESHPLGLEDFGDTGPVGQLKSVSVPLVILIFLGFVVLRFWQHQLAGTLRRVQSNEGRSE